MLVKDLIKKLQKCNPNARVYTEQYNDSIVDVVGEVDNYDYDGRDVIYLADTLCAVEEELKEEGLIIKEVK